MPLYEYSCPDCQQKFELLRSFQESDREALCPSCGVPAKRVISRFSFSGFHIHVLSPVAEPKEQ
ncbi:MAG: zinc ribbon domain-containing protein [Chloroflexi bacterium]|nr:zinc ribbon domain-containing protein [Chloroflexota bacterium]